MSSVDSMVFVGNHIRAKAQERFGWDGRRLIVIPNFVDTVAFDRPKTPQARFTLGVLGFVPSLKRLDKALDLLERLRSEDRRYRLILKGAHPWDAGWDWSEGPERRFYMQQFDRIHSSELLRSSVVFEKAGQDVPSWFQGVGFILSLSDIESFHVAMIEGMASRCVPIVSDREGASAIVNRRWIVGGESDAIRRIRAATADPAWMAGDEARVEAVTRYGAKVTADSWLQILQ